MQFSRSSSFWGKTSPELSAKAYSAGCQRRAVASDQITQAECDSEQSDLRLRRTGHRRFPLNTLNQLSEYKGARRSVKRGELLAERFSQQAGNIFVCRSRARQLSPATSPSPTLSITSFRTRLLFVFSAFDTKQPRSISHTLCWKSEARKERAGITGQFAVQRSSSVVMTYVPKRSFQPVEKTTLSLTQLA